MSVCNPPPPDPSRGKTKVFHWTLVDHLQYGLPVHDAFVWTPLFSLGGTSKQPTGNCTCFWVIRHFRKIFTMVWIIYGVLLLCAFVGGCNGQQCFVFH